MSAHRLSLPSVVAIVISLVIGMGIFKFPASVAATSGTPAIFYGAWLLGGLVALLGALTYAEIGLRLPAVGGYYQIFARCYHPIVGFTVNLLIVISNAASTAVVALIGADYAADLLYGAPAGMFFNATVAFVAIALFYGVNLLGLRTSSRTQNALTLLKVALVVLLISAVFTGVQVEPHGYNTEAPRYFYDGTNGLYLLLLSLVNVSFVYGGYQQTINFGGEVKEISFIPKGIFIGMSLVLALYLSICYAYVQVIGYEKMQNATAIGALLFEAWFGAVGAKVFDACMFLSVLAYVNISLMSNPRVLFAMSEDGSLPPIFGKTHPQTGAMTTGLTFFAVFALLCVLAGKGIDNLLSFTMFLDSIGMATSAATIYILRRRAPGELRSGWHRLTPLFAAVFILAYIVIATMVTIDKPLAAGIGVGLLLGLAGLFIVIRK